MSNVDVALRVNGIEHEVTVDARTMLLDALRERLGLTGTKKGCDRGQRGACTILVDGRRINSCLALAVAHQGAEILTIEGLAAGDDLHPLQRAFVEHDAFQCGYCRRCSHGSSRSAPRQRQMANDRYSFDRCRSNSGS